MTAWPSVAPGEALAPIGARAGSAPFHRSDWLRLAALYGAVAALHIAGWGAYLLHAPAHPALVGLGFVAYLLGLRHAFDADHIAAVDDTVRYLHRTGRRPLGVGFFFSLGHATVVCVLALVLVFAAAALQDMLPALQRAGGIVAPVVSGTFLWLIGLLNLRVLRDLVASRSAPGAAHTHAHLDELAGPRALMGRLFGGRVRRLIRHSWQMYPLGLLFGLGFDTATEVVMLAMTAGASAGSLPLLAVMSLPLLFAAGMTLMDTTDGVLMTRACDWAFVDPLRRIAYNVAITTLSIVVALAVGTIQWLQAIAGVLGLSGPLAGGLAAIDLTVLGYLVVGSFAATWAGSVAIWKLARIGQRYGPAPPVHSHVNDQSAGVTDAHPRVHESRRANRAVRCREPGLQTGAMRVRSRAVRTLLPACLRPPSKATRPAAQEKLTDPL